MLYSLEDKLRSLASEALIYEERALPEEEYSFRHVLAQEAIYQSIPEPRRQVLHQQVGEAIEALHAESLEAEYEHLAYHYERTGNAAKAIDYLLKAGEKSRRAYLNDAAIGYFERALARLEDTTDAATTLCAVPSSAQGTRPAADDRFEALTGLGKIHQRLGNLDEAEKLLRQAVALGKEAGLAPRRRVRTLHHLGELLWWQFHLEDRVRLGEEGLALLGSDMKCEEALLMQEMIAWGHFSMGNPHLAREHQFRVRPLLRSLPYSEELLPAYVHQSVGACLFEKSMASLKEWCQRLERVASEAGDRTAVAEANLHLAQGLIQSFGELDQGVFYARWLGINSRTSGRSPAKRPARSGSDWA
jgi:tetratricopeptide (TPR) repeat protein